MIAYWRRLYRLYRPSAGWTAVALLCIVFSSLVLTLVIGTTRVLLSGDQRLRDPNSLTVISLSLRSRDSSFQISPSVYQLWVSNAKSFESIAAEVGQVFLLPVKFGDRSADNQLNVGVVTANYFSTLGITTRWGRAFVDGSPLTTAEVMLSESLWRQQFAADPDVLGRIISINGQPYTIIGVAPDSYPAGAQLWLDRPLEISHILDTPLPINAYFNVWGRLKPGISRQQAAAELDALLPEGLTGMNQPATATVRSITGFLIQQHATAARFVGLAAVAMFFITCGNAAMVLLLRALSRRRDIAVRYALGATRRRIIWLAFAEALGPMILVTLFVLGLLPASVHGFVRFLPPGIAARGLPVDIPLVSISIAASALCILLPNLVTLTVLLRPDHGELVRTDPNSLTPKESSLKARGLLLAVQLTITVAVSTVALSLLKSAQQINESQLGINPENCIILDELLSGQRLSSQESQVRYLQRTLPRLEQVHGVVSVGAVNFPPLGAGEHLVTVETQVSSENRPPDLISADEAGVSGNYFSAIGTPLLRGRDFNWSDTTVSEPVVIVDKALSEKIARGAADALGKIVKIEGINRTIVGIAGSAQFRGLDRSFTPLIYVPLSQSHFAFPFASIVVRVDQPSGSMLRTVQAVVSEIPDSKIKSADLISNVLAATLRPQTAALHITGLLAGIGFVLSIIGMSASIAYAVSRRKRDIGIRLALGATRMAIGKTILQGTFVPVLAGIIGGLVLANWSSQQIRALLYNVGSFDVEVYLLVPLSIFVAAACAVVAQLRRVVNTRPETLLRAR